MKLRSLELEQFRKFAAPVRIGGFADGLNVLCGPNEFGKSTLLAAIRGLLFERHASRAEKVRSMQPWGGNAAPRLAMEFELGDAGPAGRWRIEKRFLHQPWARLTGPDGRVFEADAAEEELQRLLGFGAAGRKGGNAEQEGVWGALWVAQKEAVKQADLSSDLARATVASALDAEVGVLTGGEKGQAVMRAARQHLAALLDGNGRPRARYKDVIALLAETDKRLAELRDRAARLTTDAEALRTATAQHDRQSDPAARQQEEDGLADARRRKEAAQLDDQKRAAAQAQLDLARQQHRAAAQERAARAERHAAIDAATAAQAMADRAESACGAQAAAAAQVAAACRQADAAAQTRLHEAASAARRARAVLDLARQDADLVALRGRLAQAAAAQDRVAPLQARLDRLGIDATSIAAIRRASQDHAAARAVLQAQATAIDVALDPVAAGRVTLDGAALPPGPSTVAVTAPASIAIAGIGRITVRPAIRDAETLRARVEQAAAALRDLLAAAGCADPDAAERRLAERAQIEAALRDARADLARLAPGDPAALLPPGIAALRERAEVLAHRIAAARAELDLPALPASPEAAAAVRAAEDEDLAARDQQAQARAELDAAAAAAAAARDAQAAATAAAARARDELARLRRDAAAAEAREPDAALAARLAAAEAHEAAYAATLAALERDRSPDTVAAMDARIARYEQALRNRDEGVRNLRETIAGLRARITQEGGAGLDEIIAAAAREHDALTRERDAAARETDVLKLLLATLAEAERETKERYLAPVTRRVTPYLRALFPDAVVTCDDDLRITALARAGADPQAFDRLSDGTQEQLAVLARLAFAELLADQGRPAMVILDDALAFSDDERIERMFDVLSQAAARLQIVVLTCREDRFARLGGHRLTLRPLAPAAVG